MRASACVCVCVSVCVTRALVTSCGVISSPPQLIPFKRSRVTNAVFLFSSTVFFVCFCTHIFIGSLTHPDAPLHRRAETHQASFCTCAEGTDAQPGLRGALCVRPTLCRHFSVAKKLCMPLGGEKPLEFKSQLFFFFFKTLEAVGTIWFVWLPAH